MGTVGLQVMDMEPGNDFLKLEWHPMGTQIESIFKEKSIILTYDDPLTV